MRHRAVELSTFRRLREVKAVEPPLQLRLPHPGSRHLLLARREWPDKRFSPISRRPHSESKLSNSKDCPCAVRAESFWVGRLELPAYSERLPLRVDVRSFGFASGLAKDSTPYPRSTRDDRPTRLALEPHR